MKERRHFIMAMTLLMLLLASCGMETPPDPGPDASAGNPHRMLTVRQIHDRLNNLWGSLPKTPGTRGSEVLPPIDSIITVPGGDIIGVDNGNGDLFAQEEIEIVDTIDTYALAFTFKDNKGFVIMSAKEGLPDLLYYAESGTFDMTPKAKDHSGFHVFLDYLSQWVNLQFSAEDDLEYGGSTWENEIVMANEKGVPVQWGQYVPYNLYCPTGMPTGCLATALAQVMAYHKYPSSYNGYNFNWTLMLSVTKQTNSTEQGSKDVSKLMAQLGGPENLNIQYGANGSTGYIKDAKRTLINFGYDGKAKIVHYNYAVLKKQINSNKPVVMAGSPRYGMGHAWVADGYMIRRRPNCKDIKYVHCNWGRNGKDNGFAVSGPFDPENVIGMEPGDSDESEIEYNGDMICGGYISPTSYYRNNYMVINIHP